jgi:SNF family Na+-dependent transporter
MENAGGAFFCIVWVCLFISGMAMYYIDQYSGNRKNKNERKTWDNMSTSGKVGLVIVLISILAIVVSGNAQAFLWLPSA